MPTEQRLPILDTGGKVTLSEAIGREVYAAYAKQYGGGQSYKRICERGGFGLFECILILHNLRSTDRGFYRKLMEFLARAWPRPLAPEAEVIQWSRNLAAAPEEETLLVMISTGVTTGRRCPNWHIDDVPLSHRGEPLAWAYMPKGPQP